MRRFRDIVEDIKAPSPQSLWLDNGKLKFFGTKGWVSMVGEGDDDRQELEEKVDNLDKEVGSIQTSLSKYARLDEYNIFNGDNYFNKILAVSGQFMVDDIKSQNSIYLRAYDKNDQSSTKTYVTNGELANIGTEEHFVFTLEDGSKVTKSIRVVSSTKN